MVISSPACRLFDRRENRSAFVLNQEHHDLGGCRLARVSADDVHVVGTFIERLTGDQSGEGPSSDLHHDRAFQYVDHRLRMMRMYRVRPPGEYSTVSINSSFPAV